MDDAHQDAGDTTGATEPPPAADPEAARSIDTVPAPGGQPATGRTALVLAVTLAVVFAATSVVLGMLLAGADGDDALDDLRRTAGSFGETLVSYDYRDPEAHRDAVLAFATGSFREEYEDAFDQGLGTVITEVKAVSKGFVKDVYVTSVDEERAQAIVVVDIEHDGTSGPSTLFDVYFRLTMVEVGGTWKVDQVTDLNFDAGTGAPPGGSVTTDTMAPAPTSVP